MSGIPYTRDDWPRKRSPGLRNALAARDGTVAQAPARCPSHRIRRGEHLYGPGDAFHALYVVRSGFLKVCAAFVDGSTQVFGFPMAGDVLGLDALHSGFHASAAIALDDSEVFLLSYALYERWLRDFPLCHRHLARLLADQIVRDQELLLLRAAPAEQRLATFLLDLSERYRQRGYSRSRFIVRMTRQEMGGYLGLTLETVSRVLSRLQREGMIQVEGKSFALLDFPALWRLCGRPAPEPRTMPEPLLDTTGELRVIA